MTTDVTNLPTSGKSDWSSLFLYVFNDLLQGKISVQSLLDYVENAVSAARQFGSAAIYPTWTALSAVTGAADQVALIFADTGTHTDPVTAGTVSNSGFFIYVEGTPAGWKRFADTEAGAALGAANDAEAALSGITATLEALGLVSEYLGGALLSLHDPAGRYWIEGLPDMAVRIQGIEDGFGNRLDQITLSNRTRIELIEAKQAYDAPDQRRKMKRAIYDSRGLARQVYASDPITVGAYTTSSAISGGVSIAKNDARLLLGGGKWVAGSAYPHVDDMILQTVTRGSSTITNQFGLPVNTLGPQGFVDVPLPAGIDTFEFKVRGNGAALNFFVDIDGIGTNAAGYAPPPNNTGALYYIPITVPSSASDRIIRVTVAGQRPFAGLVLPPGGTLASYTPPVGLSMAVMGDSITEGSVASSVIDRWVTGLGYRLGVHNLVNLGSGGSGWLQPAPGVTNGTGYNALQRINDVLTAIDGEVPDVVLWALGINDIGVAEGSGSWTPEQIGGQAELCLQAVADAAPDTVQMVLGPFTDWNNAGYNSWLQEGADALAAACAAVGRCDFISVADWVTPANRDTVFNGTVNGPHPIDGGHAIYRDRAFEAISAIVSGF